MADAFLKKKIATTFAWVEWTL